MTDDELVKVVTAINQTVLDVVCPPGTIALLVATAVVVPPAMIWLLWTLSH